MTLINTGDGIKLTNVSGGTIFDTKNNMPHITGSAEFIGDLSIDEYYGASVYAGGFTYCHKFFNTELSTSLPLSIQTNDVVDFLLVSIRINDYKELGKGLVQLILKDKWLNINGSILFEIGVSWWNNGVALHRIMTIEKVGNAFFANFKTTSKYTGQLCYTIAAGGSNGGTWSGRRETKFNANIKLKWGRFTNQ